MAKHRTHKAQHFVPRTYLAAWTDPDTPERMTPYVWTFPREGGDGRRKAPSNLFTETDMYTIPLPDGGRDLRIEHGLGHLEAGLQPLRDQYIERRRQLPAPRFMRFIAFIAAMHGRTRRFRDHQREQWQRILDAGRRAEASIRTKTPEEIERISRMTLHGEGPTMSLDDVQTVVDQPVQSMISAVLAAEVPILSQMVMTIYCTDSSPGFITSDNPVVWFDPESETRAPLWRGPALMYDSIEITMALSPRHLVAIHHDQPMSRGIKPIRYVDAWEDTVLKMNRRTAFHADESIVTCRDHYNPLWNFWTDMQHEKSAPPGDGEGR